MRAAALLPPDILPPTSYRYARELLQYCRTPVILHPTSYRYARELLQYCRAHGIAVQAYGSGGGAWHVRMACAHGMCAWHVRACHVSMACAHAMWMICASLWRGGLMHMHASSSLHASKKGTAFTDAFSLAWLDTRDVAWRGVAWRGVAWRGVA